MSSEISFHQTSGILGHLPLSTIFPVFFVKQRQKETNNFTEKTTPWGYWVPQRSCPTLETAPALNTKCFCFVFFFSPPRSLPSSVETKQAAILWASDSKKILGPQCVHSTLDSLALGTAFKCEGTMRQLKGKGRRFGSKIRFSGGGHPKCNVRILWTKHSSSLKSHVICSDFVWSVTFYLPEFSMSMYRILLF